MSNNVLLIHGTWCNGHFWSEMRGALRDRGFTVYAPTLRHHGKPGEIDVWAEAQQVGSVGLIDYVRDLQRIVETMDEPPIIIGHSVGGLLAQLLADRAPHRGLVLLAPAPAYGMRNLDPAPIFIWGRYLGQWLMGKPMYPCDARVWRRWICHELDDETAAKAYASLSAESGTAYRQMVLWPLDPKRSSKVNHGDGTSPVLVVSGSKDRVTVPRIARQTAAAYRGRATHVELAGSGHMMLLGDFLPQTLAAFDEWSEAHSLLPTPAA